MQEREQHANGIPIFAGSQVERRGRSTVTQEQNRPPKAAGIRKDILALDSIIIMVGNKRRGHDHAREKQDVTSGKPRRGMWGRDFRLCRTWSTAVVVESLSSTSAVEM